MGSMVFLISVCPYVERPGAQWFEGPACLLCCHHDDQPVLHHLHWSSKWVSLAHSAFTLHACLQPRPKINCSLSQPTGSPHFSQTVYCSQRRPVYFNLLCFGTFLECGVGHNRMKLQRGALHNRAGNRFSLTSMSVPFPHGGGKMEVKRALTRPLAVFLIISSVIESTENV